MTRSRWLDWQHPEPISENFNRNEPTKPSKSGFVGFDGATSIEFDNIDLRPSASSREWQINSALTLLNRFGARIVTFGAGDEAVGVWSDLDGPDLRAALRTAGLGELPVIYLDSPRCPTRYKVRSVAGEPVPLSVLEVMEAAESEPWCVRDALVTNTNRGNGLNDSASSRESVDDGDLWH